MGYRIVSVDNAIDAAFVQPTALGIKYASTDRVFTTIYTTTEQALENLKNLLLTRVGERYGYPQFGTHLLNALFQPITAEMKSDIRDLIIEPISTFLPYIDVQEIDITTQEDDPDMIEYMVKIRLEFALGNFDTRALLLEATNTGILRVSEV